MKRIIGVFIFCIGSISASLACSLCGCAASNQYLGILPPSKTNFIGIQYEGRQFNSIHQDEFDETGNKIRTNEHYTTLQIWGRYNLGRKIQLFAFVPYIINSQTEGDVRTTIKGLGDITMLASMRIVGNKCQGRVLEHSLQVGGGIKIPTGKYNVASIKYGDGLPNMQPGTRSFDFIANANYTMIRKGIGLNIESSCTVTTPNPDNYKYGNRLSSGATAFCVLRQKKLNILPQVGVRYDYALKDYDNYIKKAANDMAGGYQVYATAGLQLFSDHVGFQLSGYKPVSQVYANGLVVNRFKAQVAVYFLF